MDSCEGIDSFYFFRSPFVWSDYDKDDFVGIFAVGSLSRFMRLGLLLNFSASLFSDVVGFCIISFGRTAFSREVLFLSAIETFSLFFWNRGFFRSLFLEIFFSFSEYRIGFSVYLVGMSFWFFLKISVLIISLIFLGFFSEIVVEARDCRD
jgi:hypothetical protein